MRASLALSRGSAQGSQPLQHPPVKLRQALTQEVPVRQVQLEFQVFQETGLLASPSPFLLRPVLAPRLIFKANRVAKEVKGSEEARVELVRRVRALPRMLLTAFTEPETAERGVEVERVARADAAGVAERVGPLH